MPSTVEIFGMVVSTTYPREAYFPSIVQRWEVIHILKVEFAKSIRGTLFVHCMEAVVSQRVHYGRFHYIYAFHKPSVATCINGRGEEYPIPL